jgi:hypothetical protein
MLTNPDEGSVKGKGAETMLPTRGNPFRSAAPAGSAAGGGGGPAPAASRSVDLGGTPDLTPEDLARLFPDAPSPSLMAAEAAMPEAPAADSGFAAVMGPYATMPGAPEASQPAPEPAMTPAATAAGASAPEARETGSNMFDPEIQWVGIEINPEAIGPRADIFQRGEVLATDAALLGMFATDQRLQQCWSEIDQLEDQVTTIPRLSLKLAQGLLDELASARNRLLNNRDQIEEAEREVAEVRYRLQRIHRSKWFEQPSIVFGAIVVMLLLIVFGAATPFLFPVFFDTLSAQVARLYPPETSNVRLADVWNTIVWGGLGGVTGALYGLWVHVADKKDFDVEYSMWYYANPLMGMMLGAFIYVLVMSGVLTFLQSSPMVMYILAWVVGFQQNVAFKLVNNVLKRLAPDDTSKVTPGEA